MINNRKTGNKNSLTIPKTKEELIKEIIDNYTKLTTELSTIPKDCTTNKELEGHSKNTLISINNLIAYLVGWGQLVLKWNNRDYMEAAASLGIALAFDPFNLEQNWNQRPTWQKTLLIAHLALVAAMFGFGIGLNDQ